MHPARDEAGALWMISAEAPPGMFLSPFISWPPPPYLSAARLKAARALHLPGISLNLTPILRQPAANLAS